MKTTVKLGIFYIALFALSFGIFASVFALQNKSKNEITTNEVTSVDQETNEEDELEKVDFEDSQSENELTVDHLPIEESGSKKLTADYLLTDENGYPVENFVSQEYELPEYEPIIHGEPADTQSIEIQIASYLDEREQCIQEGATDYYCSTIVLADKYYDQDPDGITNLCVLTENLTGYIRGIGILAEETPETIEEMHAYGLAESYWFDDQGNAQMEKEAFDRQKEFCAGVIELNQLF